MFDVLLRAYFSSAYAVSSKNTDGTIQLPIMLLDLLLNYDADSAPHSAAKSAGHAVAYYDVLSFEHSVKCVSADCSAYYAVVLLLSNSLLPALSCVMLSLLALSVTFRESYNYYLVKTRRLKSTPKQWLKFIMKKGV